MLHAEPFETHLLSSELCVLFIYFLKGNCIGLEYHIILSKIHIIVIIKTKIIDKNKSCSNRSMFQDLVLKSGGEVKFGGDQKGKIIGSGTIKSGNSPSISNVLLVE